MEEFVELLRHVPVPQVEGFRCVSPTSDDRHVPTQLSLDVDVAYNPKHAVVALFLLGAAAAPAGMCCKPRR
jgi:hypothetical protein